jgi:diguanylate cyclase (GGDEF)-like protein/PAS domain S-box-containing protein
VLYSKRKKINFQAATKGRMVAYPSPQKYMDHLDPLQHEGIFQKSFEHAAVGMAHMSVEGRWLRVNRKLCEITGYNQQELLAMSFQGITHPDDAGRDQESLAQLLTNTLPSYAIEKRYIHRNGSLIWVLIQVSVVFTADGIADYGITVIQDISEKKQAAQLIESMAYNDQLTGLPNRSLLGDRLHQAMTLAHRHKRTVAVVFLDLDGFKAINDRYGHATGDLLLRALSVRMKDGLREGDTLARLGGDEFVAVFLDLPDSKASTPMLARLLVACAQPVPVGSLNLQVSASLGVTFYPQAEEVDADQLLRQADQAMYQAKLAGKNRYHVFDAENDRSVRGHHASVERIRSALQQQEFVLHYQPKVNMRTRQVVGVEALIRWNHPQAGLLLPGEFLPLIENHRLAVDVGEWVIHQALQQLSEWHGVGLELPVSVNISAMELQQADFLERLQSAMQAYPDLPAHSLQLEILETSALDDLDQVSRFITQCADLCVDFAIDDFGTGYSSLTYLKHLPIPVVKIDQSFVRDMLLDQDNKSILDGILWIMRQLKRSVIAEGVETLEHGRALMDLGCELAQGYGIARPMPVDQLPEWVAAWEQDAEWQAVSLVPRTAV